MSRRGLTANVTFAVFGRLALTHREGIVIVWHATGVVHAFDPLGLSSLGPGEGIIACFDTDRISPLVRIRPACLL